MYLHSHSFDTRICLDPKNNDTRTIKLLVDVKYFTSIKKANNEYIQSHIINTLLVVFSMKSNLTFDFDCDNMLLHTNDIDFDKNIEKEYSIAHIKISIPYSVKKYESFNLDKKLELDINVMTRIYYQSNNDTEKSDRDMEKYVMERSMALSLMSKGNWMYDTIVSGSSSEIMKQIANNYQTGSLLLRDHNGTLILATKYSVTCNTHNKIMNKTKNIVRKYDALKDILLFMYSGLTGRIILNCFTCYNKYYGIHYPLLHQKIRTKRKILILSTSIASVFCTIGGFFVLSFIHNTNPTIRIALTAYNFMMFGIVGVGTNVLTLCS